MRRSYKSASMTTQGRPRRATKALHKMTPERAAKLGKKGGKVRWAGVSDRRRRKAMTSLASRRWKGTTKAERSAFMTKMIRKRWANRS